MEKIGNWGTDRLARFVTQSIPSGKFPIPKGLKLDSLDVNDLKVNSQFQHKAEASIIVAPAGAAQPAFQNGWGNVGGAMLTVRFWKDPWGVVHLEGNATNAGGPGFGNTTVIFTLPVGYRPPGTVQLVQRANQGGVDYVGFLNILGTGTVGGFVTALAANAAVGGITVEGTFRV